MVNFLINGIDDEVCDIRKWSQVNSDWPIAKLVGAATYAQLLDAAPGLFEPFPDWRSDGNTASSISTLTYSLSNVANLFCHLNGKKSKEDESPVAPNLVSTILVDCEISPAELKRLLICAALDVTKADPRIESLINSSISYNSPELSLGEIVLTFAIYSIFAALTICVIIHVLGGELTCSAAGGCPIMRRKR